MYCAASLHLIGSTSDGSWNFEKSKVNELHIIDLFIRSRVNSSVNC